MNTGVAGRGLLAVKVVWRAWTVSGVGIGWAYLGLALALLVVVVVSLGVGAVPISSGSVLSILGAQLGLQLPWDYTPVQETVLLSIRAPRAVLGLLVGGGLAISGAAMQGLFRNPLADPALVGVSSGAALAAVSVIVLGSTLLHGFTSAAGLFALPVSAFLGGFFTTLLVFRLARIGGRTDVATMLLAGIAINAVAGAGTGLLTFVADDEQLRSLTFWTLGSLGGGTWEQLMIATPLIVLPVLLIPLYAPVLNAVLLGEAEAGHLGFDLERMKLVLILCVALIVGTAVSMSGIIGFVGLVVPHLLRLAFGPDHRFLLPATALLGALLMLAADLLARTVVAPSELPIGIITALIGGPFFLWLLLKRRARLGL